MASINDTSFITYARPSFMETVSSAVRPALTMINRRIVALRTRSELSRLTDRQLDDIGVERAMIPELSMTMAERTCL